MCQGLGVAAVGCGGSFWNRTECSRLAVVIAAHPRGQGRNRQTAHCAWGKYSAWELYLEAGMLKYTPCLQLHTKSVCGHGHTDYIHDVNTQRHTHTC